MAEKEEADKDLQVALPYLRRAEAAVESIRPKDIGELKLVKQATDTTRVIMDAVQLLFQLPMVPIAPKTIKIAKQDIEFIADGFDEHTKATMINQKFLEKL